MAYLAKRNQRKIKTVYLKKRRKITMKNKINSFSQCSKIMIKNKIIKEFLPAQMKKIPQKIRKKKLKSCNSSSKRNRKRKMQIRTKLRR